MVAVGLWIEGETTIGQRLVTGGVAMEVICAWWVLIATRKLQNILETEFETLRLETAEANRRAAEAVTRGKEAEARAAEANEKAEHERLERLKIERQIAPRAISPEQHKSIVDQLLAYRPDVPVGVFAAKQNAEIMSFSNSLIWALSEAKWPVSAGVKEDQYRAVVGVVIEVRANADSKDWVRAEALAAVLRGQQIDVFGPNVMEIRGGYSFRGSLEVIEMSPIHVIVGEKVLSL